MNKYFIGYNPDFFGFFASFLCAIHCAVLPFVMTVGIFSGLSWLANPWLEVTFIILSIFLAVTSLYPSYQHKHHNPTALTIAAVGFVLLFISRVVGHGSAVEVGTIVIGGLLVATAHIVNWRLLKNQEVCSQTCCEHKIRNTSLRKAS